jgi:DNA-binding response OmpR family regulator
MNVLTCPILLVEDEDDDVQFVRRALHIRRIVNPVVVIPDVESAKAYLRRSISSAGIPVLAVVDLYLPRGGNGLELISWMRTEPKLVSLPVIVLTVSTDRTHEAHAIRAAAALFLRKPITPEVLVDAIDGLGLAETRATHDGKIGVQLEPNRR